MKAKQADAIALVTARRAGNERFMIQVSPNF